MNTEILTLPREVNTANASKMPSRAGWIALRLSEGAVLRYYDDIANKGTYGIGTLVLVHTGPCAREEISRPMTPSDVNVQLAAGVRTAENTVRHRVTDHELTQDPFDALVSFTYNLGPTSARLTLARVLVSTSALAIAANPVEEIAKQSGLAASEVAATLAGCEANQTSMNFCAWRDQIVAEHKLELAVAAKAGSSAACEKALKKKIAVWKKHRDAECSRSTARDWGGGSMSPTPAAMCKTAETDRMRETIVATKCK